jgi:MFS family permease
MATLVSAAGNGVALVALPWVVLELTGSAADVGLVAAVAAVPLVLAGLVSGTIVDRFGRRRTAVVSDVLSGVSVAAIPVAADLGLLSLGLLAALAALGSVFDPAGVTARETMLPDAADAARLRRERVNGIHEAVFGVAFLSAPRSAGCSSRGSGPRRPSGRRRSRSQCRRSRRSSSGSRARRSPPGTGAARCGATVSKACSSSGTTECFGR